MSKLKREFVNFALPLFERQIVYLFMKNLLKFLFLPVFAFAQNVDLVINDLILKQEYENALKLCVGMKKSDSLFFTAQIEYSKLVDYEAYETENGKKLIAVCENAVSQNLTLEDSALSFYRTAVLGGMLSTIHIKRGAYLQGISKTGDVQKNWEKLLDSKYSDEAVFALALTQYYKITLFNKNPKNQGKLYAVLKNLQKSLSKNDDTSKKLYLSYIWVLQEQKLWDEAKKISDKFFEKYPKNTMMLRACQEIFIDKKEIEEIKVCASNLYNLSAARNPKNYSDMLSARRAEIFALDLENKKTQACKTANSAIGESQDIPQETKKTYWVKKHLETIKKYGAQCK